MIMGTSEFDLVAFGEAKSADDLIVEIVSTPL